MTVHRDILQAIKRTTGMLRRRARLASAYAHVWESPEGRVVFNDIFGKAGLLTNIAAPASEDERSYAAGQRSIAIHIIERMRWSEGELVRLARQQNEDALNELEAE